MKKPNVARQPVKLSVSAKESDIAILCRWQNNDFASILSAWALYHFLKSKDKKPVLLNAVNKLYSSSIKHSSDDETLLDIIPDNIDNKVPTLQATVINTLKKAAVPISSILEETPPLQSDISTIEEIDPFLLKHCNVNDDIENFQDLESLKPFINKYILHLDMVDACQKCNLAEEPYLFLNFTDRSSKKVAFACDLCLSYGDNCQVRSNLNWTHTKEYLQSFDIVSVREDTDRVLAMEKLSIEPPTLLDPIYLVDPIHFVGLADEKIVSKAPFIFTYFTSDSVAKQNYCTTVSNRQQLDLIATCDSVEEFLACVVQSKHIITDSTQMVSLAIRLHKDFVLLKSNEQYSWLYKQLGLSNRTIHLDDTMKNESYLYNKHIDYQDVDAQLMDLIRETISSLNIL